MDNILLKNSFVTNSDINACVTRFELIMEGKAEPKITLEASQIMNDIDIQLIGYFILFKEQNSKIIISLILEKNQESEDANSLEYKLKQMGTYAYLMTRKNVFNVQYGAKKFGFELDKLETFPNGWFVFSEHFMLLMLISPNDIQYKLLFEDKFSNLVSDSPLKGSVQWQANNAELFNEYQSEIISSSLTNRRKQSIINLARIAFYKSLRFARILSIYTDEAFQNDSSKKHEDLQVGNLTTTNEKGNIIYDNYNFYENVKYIFDELKELPLVYHFVYAQLLATDLLPPRLTKESRIEFEGILVQLWKFTKELVYGIMELAKNIREHANPKMGMITARIDTKLFKDLYKNQTSGVNNYSDFLSDIMVDENGNPLKGVLHIHVFDLGEKGVIPKLIEETELLIKLMTDYDNVQNGDIEKKILIDDPGKKLVNLLNEDLQNLKEGKFHFKGLLSPNNTSQLNQQMKRSIAHLGLLSFSRLILENNGCIDASTKSIDGKREGVNVRKKGYGTYDFVTIGTNYSIVLPIHPGKKFSPFQLQSSKVFADGTYEEFKGLELLFKYSLFQIGNNEKLPTKGNKVIISYKPKLKDLNSHADEFRFWEEFNREIIKVIHSLGRDRSNDYLVHIDFDENKYNASIFLRFLGQWEINYPRTNLIFTNIDVQTFFEMKRINDFLVELTKSKSIDYWNADSAVFIYSFLLKRDTRFYFTDAFWGNTKKDFIGLNKLISRNHFNAITLIEKETSTNKVDEEYFDFKPNHNHLAFYKKNMLLPFDIMLQSNNGMSIFENNAIMLLKNEMIQKNNSNVN